MRIYILGRSLPDPSTGSIGVFEFEQAALLHRQGLDVVYLFSDNQSPVHLQTIKKVQKNISGLPVFGSFFPAGLKLFPLYNKIKTMGLQWAFRQAEHCYGKPDIVHIHYPLLTLTLPFWDQLKNLGIPLVVTEHWSRVQEKKVPPKLLPLQQTIYRQADFYVPVGQGIFQALQEQYGPRQQMKVVPNAVYSKFELIQLPKDGIRPFVFLYVGRLVDEKRVDLLVKAFAAAFHNDIRAKLQIIGPGPEMRNLKKLIAEQNLQNAVRLLGGMPHTEVAERMKQADCIVTASAYETFCLPVAEGWMCGKPAIFPKNLPLSIYMDPTLGRLFEPGDVQSLGDAMIDLFQKGPEMSPQRIAEFAQQHFSEEAVGNCLRSIYDDFYNGENL